MDKVLANGKIIQAKLPCSLSEFLRVLNLPSLNVVVEHNGEAVSPSQFAQRQVSSGDRLEIVQIAAGG